MTCGGVDVAQCGGAGAGGRGEGAARAGHSVDVLMKVYAKCLHGQREAVNERIAAVLGDGS